MCRLVLLVPLLIGKQVRSDNLPLLTSTFQFTKVILFQINNLSEPINFVNMTSSTGQQAVAAAPNPDPVQQMNTYRSFVSLLIDPTAREESKLKAVQELAEDLEVRFLFGTILTICFDQMMARA